MKLPEDRTPTLREALDYIAGSNVTYRDHALEADKISTAQSAVIERSILGRAPIDADQAEAMKIRDAAVMAAWSRLVAAVRKGANTLRGKRDRYAAHEVVPREYFDFTRTVITWSDEIDPIAGNGIADIFGPRRYDPKWFEVVVDGDLSTLRPRAQGEQVCDLVKNPRSGKRALVVAILAETFGDIDPKSLPAKVIEARVSDALVKRGLPKISAKTIRRAIGKS